MTSITNILFQTQVKFLQIFYAEPRRGEAYGASEGSSEKFAPLLCDTHMYSQFIPYKWFKKICVGFLIFINQRGHQNLTKSNFSESLISSLGKKYLLREVFAYQLPLS